MLIRHIDALSQALNLKLLTSAAAVDILDVICGGLEVACGVVALGDEDIVIDTGARRLVNWDGRALRGER